MADNKVNLHKGAVALPVNPENAKAAADKMTANISSGEALSAAKAAWSKNNRTASSVGFAMDKKREPLQSLKNKGIPYSVDKADEREKIRDWTRGFYATHNLMSTAIDIYTQFPIQGIEVVSKDPEIKKFYEALFFDQLDYPNFLESFGREYWTVGEVNTLANWNKTLGIWDREQIINPNDVISLPQTIINDTPQYFMRVPESIKNIIRTQSPKWEYELLIRDHPELAEAAAMDNRSRGMGDLSDRNDQFFDTRGLLSVSSHVLSRTINQLTPWDQYGSPHMMRAFGSLIMEESLNAAQDAVADRLYSPMILAKLGSEKLGDGEPWIPMPEELEEFTGQMQSAFAADFRFLAYHFGIDIHSVFGKESLPDFSKDYERLERKMLQVWGIGEALISGSSAGTYASSSVNREFVTQLMTSFQRKIKAHFKKRVEIVAEAQGHFDYDIAGGVKTEILEEVLMTDPETGKQYIKKRPKLLLPELQFASLNLKDEKEERAFLQRLSSMGVPISDQALMVNIELDFNEQMEMKKEEYIKKGVSDAKGKKELYDILVAQGLPIPAELMQEVHPELVPDNNPGGDLGGGDDMFGGTSGPGPRNPDNTGGGGAAPTEDSDSAGFSSLPRNQAEGGDTRPAESDEQRGDMPKRMSALADPSVIGTRNNLTEKEIRDAIINRKWADSINKNPRLAND